MLVLTRRLNETIEIRPVPGTEDMTLGQVFTNGSIQISLVAFDQGRARFAIDAPPELQIWRLDQPIVTCKEWEHIKRR